jgi:predicted ATPase
MKGMINKLYSEINALISESKGTRSNSLRYSVGSKIMAFYVNHKEELKVTDKEFEEELKVFYENLGIDTARLKTEKFIRQSAWDKIKIAISDALSKQDSSDGYSLTNLGYMQQFYRKFRNSPDGLEKALKLDWSHNVELLKDKLNEDERKFYLKKAISESWSVKELEKQVREDSYDDFLEILDKTGYRYKIEKLQILNYKSLVKIEIENPSQFLVFAGANATGKSNIFEALEFLMHAAMTTGNFALDIFGGEEKIINYTAQKAKMNNQLSVNVILSFEYKNKKQSIAFGVFYDMETGKLQKEFTGVQALDTRIVDSFSRIFIDNYKRAENKLKRSNRLWLDAANTSKILKNILAIDKKRMEIVEWLKVLIPGMKDIKIEKDLSGKEELLIFEESHPEKAFAGSLISEGTYNIIALLTLFYQSDEPQFICIEEPETGLNPAVLGELVPFFREMADKFHHHIWITTHSTSLVSELTEEELIIVNKKDGQTNVYPCKPGDFEEMRPDEAWMSKMLKGGGLPW